MTPKESLHKLVDELPESEHDAARRFLEYLRDAGSDPLLHALVAAPLDDEPTTEEDLSAIREADEAIARGDQIAHDKVLRGRKK
jgi:hypothetical protein